VGRGSVERRSGLPAKEGGSASQTVGNTNWGHGGEGSGTSLLQYRQGARR
jgi:hypothetical protein